MLCAHYTMTPHLSTMTPSGHQSRNLGVGKVSRSALSRWLYCTVLYCTVPEQVAVLAEEL